MNTALFLLQLAIVSIAPNQARDHVDLAELNSFHDCNGRHVYDQVIFYEWSPSLHRYHVRAWVLSDGDKQPQRDYRTGLYVTKYTERDSNLSRTVTATHFRRSWTQTDPERENKRLLPEHERHSLTKRLPITPITDELPMLEGEE
jgi:hypothetical protein